MGRRLRLTFCSVILIASFASTLAQSTASGSAVQRIDVHWNKKAGKCKAGKHGLKCSQCPKGYYSEDGTHCQRCTNFKTTKDCDNGCTSKAECTEPGCPVGTYKSPTSSDGCEPCPVGEYSKGGYPYPRLCDKCPKGTTTPGRGSYSRDQCVPNECPAGTARSADGPNCEKCRVGSFSVEGADVCSLCPAGTTTLSTGADSMDKCVCKAGHQPSPDADGSCEICKEGTFKAHKGNKNCEECPWPKTTEHKGALTVDACVCPPGSGTGATCDDCPANMVVIEDGTCGCPPGTGGPTCEECKANFFSAGGIPGNPRPKCKPCGLHFHSPPGSISAEFCECDAGFGAHAEDDSRCVPCTLGTFNPGPGEIRTRDAYTAKASVAAVVTSKKTRYRADSAAVLHKPVAQPCQRCNAAHPRGAFTTMQSGSLTASDCICMPGHGGSGCAACPEGTFSEGGRGATCQSCPAGGAGYTTHPQVAATSIASCVCLAGYGTENGACRLCPRNTYSEGGTKEECKPCPFGSTAPAGSFELESCVSVAQECPVGQIAPADAVSSEQCSCYPGFGGSGDPTKPCTICPAGTYSRGGDLEACKPCKFGYTSPAGSSSSKDCHPIDQCPAGTEVSDVGDEGTAGSSTLECRCKQGFGTTTGAAPCHMCPVGTYSEGGSFEDCKPCPFGTTSDFGASGRDKCRPVAQTCPVGQIAGPGAVSSVECGCIPGYGGGKTPSDACSLCPAGTFAPGGNTQPCKPCRFGYTSPAGSTAEAQCYPANACPSGTEAPKHKQISSVDECVCKQGYGAHGSGKDAICGLCPAGTYSKGGNMEACVPCPFGYTSPVGATGKEQCQLTPQACPIGQWAPETAVAADECRCYAGFGGGDKPSDPCTICPAGTFSTGKSLDKCVPCAFGMTSPVGSTRMEDCYPVKSCPAGTRVPPSQFRPGYASSASECKCKAGFGSTTGEGQCRLCPVGTYSEGGTMEDCKPCPFGYTSRAGADSASKCARVAQQCPPGQIAPPDAESADQCACLPGYGGAASSKDPCKICPAGSWSAGGSTQPCTPCGFGYNSPEGSASEEACYTTNACPSGTETHPWIKTPSSLSECVCKRGFGSSTGSGPCRLCPAGTFSPGGTNEDCTKCPFGHTSPEGSTGSEQCRPVQQACPIGQWAPADAVSADECRCYSGFGGGSKPSDPCTICPVGTFSANLGTARCVPCRFGYTSPEGAVSDKECYPVDACPAGTEVSSGAAGSSQLECRCKRGYGSMKGTGACSMCPVGTYSEGGTLEGCKPCPFGYTSFAGAQSASQCTRVIQKCPPGQIAPPDAVSAEVCGCLPGYGAGETTTSACSICKPGSWSPGGSIQPCVPCGFGYSGPEGAMSAEQCVPDNSCPAGTDYRNRDPARAFTVADCVCRPGHGSATGSGICRRCPQGTYSTGGSMEECVSCGFGFTSQEGAASREECRPVQQACPIGQWAPPDAVSKEMCQCYRGFGGGSSPAEACSLCPRGTYSANKGTERCLPCPFGHTGPEGASNVDDCHPIDVCPAGTGIEGGQQLVDPRQCKCMPGFGSSTGTPPCRLCPMGTWSRGWSLEDCRPCPFGSTSKAGAASLDECVLVAQPCPVGQIAPPDAVSAEECGCLPGYGAGEKPTDACKQCPAGYWSPGGQTQPCKPCGFGYTSPPGATSVEQCSVINACPAGTVFRSEVSSGREKASGPLDCVCKPGHGPNCGSGPCRLCPAGTWSSGGNMEDCAPCGFGLTSADGSVSQKQCTAVSQPCPPGQWAAPDAVSAEQCRCYRGYGGGASRGDACSLCPAGTFSANVGTERCSPCPPGLTSPEGAGDESECYPADMCPAGTAPLRDPKGKPTQLCRCKPGHGSTSGSTCRLCPVGSYAEGGSMDDCTPCPFGYTSSAGAESQRECVPESQPCPVGQIAPPDAVSEELCGCLPGYGGGATSKDPCRVCPAGSWSPGGSTQPCIPCGFAYTGPEGAWSEKQCREANACPAGSDFVGAPGAAFSVKDCVCKSGYGSVSGSGACKRCSPGSYSVGGTMEECAACPEGMTSPEGARSRHQCVLPEPTSSPEDPHHFEGASAEAMTQKVPTQKQDAAHTEPTAKATTQGQASSLRLHSNQKALDSPPPAPAAAAAAASPSVDATKGITQQQQQQQQQQPLAAAPASNQQKVQSAEASAAVPAPKDLHPGAATAPQPKSAAAGATAPAAPATAGAGATATAAPATAPQPKGAAAGAAASVQQPALTKKQ